MPRRWGWTILRPAGQYRVTAWSARPSVSTRGPIVRVLGIPIGNVTDVVPEGDRVRVDMVIDDAYDVPADADAVVLAPSLVSDRYVQFSPVYDGGAKMKDGAKVPSFSLPGGADVGDGPYTVQVEFLDVLDLVQRVRVKVADVPVCRVGGIELADDWTALVTLTVIGDVGLPADAVAEIPRSLLGEEFVELVALRHRGGAGQPARDDPRIPWSGPTATSRWKSCSARSPWCSTAAAWPSCRRSTGSSARRWRAGSPRCGARSPSWTRSSAASTSRSPRSTVRWTARTRSPAPSRRAPPR